VSEEHSLFPSVTVFEPEGSGPLSPGHQRLELPAGLRDPIPSASDEQEIVEDIEPVATVLATARSIADGQATGTTREEFGAFVALSLVHRSSF
jgi:hypothetical protein